MQPSARTNFSIASRPQGHKATGSAPSSLQPLRNTSATALPTRTMPPSLKDKGGRLLAFASGGGSKTNGSESPVEGRPPPVERPQTVAPAPIRRPMGDFREVPGISGRNTAPPRENHPLSQPPPRSPQLSIASSFNGRVRAHSSDRRQDLFSGSQLDENFMDSGITTPQNEPAVPVKFGPELTRDLRKHNSSRQPPDNRLHRPARPSDAFVMGNGDLLGVSGRPPRHNVQHVGDGFQDAALTSRGKSNGYYENEQARPESPAKPDPKLPVREIKIRKSHTGRSEAYEASEKARSPSPTIRGAQWQAHNRKEDSRRPVASALDDQDNESLAQDEHMTPRPKKLKPVIQNVLLKSSMPVTTIPTTKYRDKKRRRPSPEYDDVALRSMSFAALRQQPFDFDPSKEEQKGIGVNADNLDGKLDQFRHLGEREQHELFSNMSIEDWESSGDWFADEFTSFMKRLTEARRQKRRIIQEFEKEAANREEAVRLKSEAIDRKLCKMKQDGQRVVEDRKV
ncbi:hypothetical protein FALBO_5238 [Fusarium albosuccineum]|uniref:Extracellular mutant protein 11 C-terminal domain-containing protein n=1 Tax=Fusarium albosuccineum TaxID=1237068 RepID=A0A8H4LH02_9HYPO|nr:hypothetical protein FALBO_5238 [Fusarium albosuccineum]